MQMLRKYSHWHSVFVSELIMEEERNVPNAFSYYFVTTDPIATNFIVAPRILEIH
jgi:hypothetical protein